MTKPVVPGIYTHFKGKQYEVYGTATNTETGEELVAYRALYEPYAKCVRPKAMFTEEVERPELDYKGPRFRFVSIYSPTPTQFSGDANKVGELFKHTETDEVFIVHRSLYEPNVLCAKPVHSFIEEIDELSLDS